jgi:DNA-binding response OmpR family regulator
MAHILLIEPNTLLAKSYTQALQHAGHSVAHVAGAQSAVDAADKQAPDIVILELQLSGHSGIEFLHEFRSYVEWLDVPVVINTVLSPAHLYKIQGALRRDMGVRDILYKPHTTLQDIVRIARECVAIL